MACRDTGGRAAIGLAIAVLSCSDGRSDAVAETSGSSGATTATTSTADTTTSSTPEPSTSRAGDSSSGADTSSTGEPSGPSCDEIAISLVLDRTAPIDVADVEALAAFFDRLAAETGATLRVLPNAGVEDNPMAPCTDGGTAPGAGLSIAWAAGDLVMPGAHDALGCAIDIAQSLPAEEPDGDWMMSGLVFPLLQTDDWPPASTDLAIAMLLAETDDDQNNMYARAGMTADAWLRLAVDGDRRRATSFAMGEAGDDLHMLTYALGEHARYADWSEMSLADALDGFGPAVALACETHDDRPPPDVPGGCEHIDILFVIDGSVSMAQEQAALRGDDGEPAVFAEFTDALLAESDTLVDVRVGVISAAPGDTELHTHHDQPAEPLSTFTSCGIEGSPWLVAPSLDFAEQFACLASTRADATEETPVRNAVLALENPKNAGFVREDSLLVVVILTDEDTQDSGTPMTELRDRMLAAVGSDVQRLVVLAIAGDPGVFEMPKTTCFGPYGTATPGRRIHSVLAGLGDHGILQDICAGELATTFADVLADVVDTCADFHPEG